MVMKLPQTGFLALKLIVTGALLWLLFSELNFGLLTVRISSLQIGSAIFALVLLFGSLLLSGVRWYFVGRLIGASISLGLVTRLMLVGQFFNQVLPSSVGGDSVRAWLLSRQGVSIRRAMASVICDRVTGLVLLTTIVACTLPILITFSNVVIPSAKAFGITVNVLTVGGLLFLFLWGEPFSAWLIRSSSPMHLFGVMIRDLRRVLFYSVESQWVVSLSIMIQVMLVMSIYFCAQALEIEFSIIHLLMLPLIMLLSSIPISFAGWGLRESIMVTGLGFANIPAVDALAVSVSFGIAQILVGFPGIVIAIMLRFEPQSPSDVLYPKAP